MAPPGLQGEFGIGLLSFWTVGEELRASLQAGSDGRTYQMHMKQGRSRLPHLAKAPIDARARHGD